ncbi:MAG: dienelactone hydrolase family protein [Roseiflexaceae bacterium]|nr:dienelactone hydrolase family protein [Roseiflexaceae bacterium]
MSEIQIGDHDRAYIARPPSGSGPGLLLLHAWWGLNPFFTQQADRLAAAGFVVLAPDLNYGELASDVAAANDLMKRRDNERIAGTVLAACDALRGEASVTPGPLGVLGFSMGAAWTIWLAAERPTDVGAAALFYGSGSADWRVARAAILGHFAETDEWEPLEDVQAMEQDMRQAGRDVVFHIYPGTSHWFVESDRPEYNPEAAELAWQRTIVFLNAQLRAAG